MKRRDEGGPFAYMGCTEARLAISARTDGEEWRGTVSRLEDHLARCSACRHFELACSGERPELVALARRLRLRSSRSVPPELLASMTAVRDDEGGPGRPARHPIRLPHRLPLSWVTAVVPAAAAAAVMPLAFARSPAPAATHVPTPCTIELVARHDDSR
ncbi:MAG TPA: zf-HC2 domain-containing protein [Acidimicrobiales bacterium]|nr:zf-HC2 domain-containing protein [Acidimicrobiales bacterium]